MKRVNNNRGYALVLTLIIFTLFTVLSLSLFSVTFSGVKRTSASEKNLQALELAKMGIEDLSESIYKDLAGPLLKDGSMEKEAFTRHLEETLASYYGEGNALKYSGETGSYTVYLKDIRDVPAQNENLPTKIVTVISKGLASGEIKVIETTMRFGARVMLDALRFTVGTNTCQEVDSCNKEEGDGNVYLHGGVTIEGDLSVDGNLIVYDHGLMIKHRLIGADRDIWIASVYPVIRGLDGKAAQLLVNGQVYKMNNHPASYNEHIKKNNFENQSLYENITNKINDVLGHSVKLRKEEPGIVKEKIQISEKKDVFYYNKSKGKVYSNIIFDHETKYKNKDVYASRKNITLEGDTPFKRLSTAGNARIIGDRFLILFRYPTNIVFQEGAYIGGNLVIGNRTNSTNPDNYDKITIDGPIYVDGDLIIKGADVKFNSIIYVDGDVEIENSVINGLETANGKTGSLIVFATGNIEIHNNSLFKDTPSKIKGFFYSEKAFEMFGTGSNIKIEGGISARKIILNGIRGRSDRTTFKKGSGWHGSATRVRIGLLTNHYYFENKLNQQQMDPSRSRLQVIYDPEIMNTYADIKSREPAITEINIPIIIEQQIVK